MNYRYNYRFLQSWMAENDISNRRVLEAIGTQDNKSMNAWKNGERPMPVETMLRVCNTFAIPLACFFFNLDDDAPQRIRPPGRVVHRPEVVREDVRVGLAGIRRGVEEILQAAEGVALAVGVFQRCGAERIGIAHPLKGQGTASVCLFPCGISFIEEFRNLNLRIINQIPITIQACDQFKCSLIITGILTIGLIQRIAVKRLIF